MPSRWGKRHDLPGFDGLRTGLTYAEVYDMLRTSTRHNQKRRGSVLGFWHEIKLQLYEQAVDRGLLDVEVPGEIVLEEGASLYVDVVYARLEVEGGDAAFLAPFEDDLITSGSLEDVPIGGRCS